MKKKASHQYDGIQVLRLFAALLVVVTHSFFYTSERLGGGAVEWGYGSRGVDIFFVISGFVMIIASRSLIHDPRGWIKFAIQRITRVVPMYWVATTIKLLVMLGSAGLVIHSSFAIDDVIKSYFFIPYEKSSGKIEPLLGVGWTLVFEMFFYIVFTIALFLRANPYLFVGSVLAVFSVLSTLRPEQHPVWMYLFDPIVLEFFFGMIVGYFTLKERFLGLQLAIIIAVASILSLVLLPGFGYSRVVVAGLPATLLIYSCVSIEPYLRDRIPRVLLYFGAASYSLYLFHPLFLPAVPLLLHKMQLQIVPLSVALCIISALSLAAIVYRFIELPITHAFRRLPFVAGYSHKSVTEIK